MRARTKRIWIIVFSAILLGGAAALALTAIRQSAMYFVTPERIALEGLPEAGKTLRVGGMVEPGSVEYGEGADIRFVVTDGVGRIPVRYTGLVPDLFREGSGVIADGVFSAEEEGVFLARRILAKHDEKYVPRELKGMESTAMTHPGE